MYLEDIPSGPQTAKASSPAGPYPITVSLSRLVQYSDVNHDEEHLLVDQIPICVMLSLD